MKTYTLYFEFFGRKMKTTVSAESCQEAKDQVADRLNFISIYEDLPPHPERKPAEGNSIFDFLKGLKK